MSESQRVEGNRVYCHVCDHEWDRAQGGLQCPSCESEFVEIIDANSRSADNSPPPIPPHPRAEPSPHPPLSNHPLHTHNPWAPDPEEDDITTFEFNTGGGRGTFSFSSRTYTIGGGNIRTSRNIATDELTRNFENMLGNIMGFQPHRQANTMGGFMFPPNRTDRGMDEPPIQPPNLFSMLFQGPGQQRNSGQSMLPFDLLGAMLNPANARHGDTVFSQEAFDRVMTQLMEQNSTNAPGPASDSAIAALKKKAVDEDMLGNEGKAECSICMDNVDLGEEVTFLPCNHWFHGDCVISWLREHDTCPHCRKPITNPEEVNRPSQSSRRRSSRRASSVSSPRVPTRESDRTGSFPDSPSGLREARQRYYGRTSSFDANDNHPTRERRTSDRSQHINNENDGGGGAAGALAGWIRSRLPFSGQQ